MKIYLCVLMVLAGGALSGCGKKGPLRASEDAIYPKSYPASSEDSVAE